MKTTVSLVISTLLASTTAADTLWRQYGFNAAHTSYNDSETILSPSNVSHLTLLWTSDTFNAQATAPTLGPTSVFVASDGRVRALKENSGVRRWVRLSCSGEETVQPAFSRGLLLVGDGGGDLAAYDPVTGERVWCDDESGSITSAPAVTDDTVYITNGGDAIAIDQFTGTRRWTFTPTDFSPLTETPAIANGVVYVTGGSAVFALDQATGHRIWRHNLEPQANISAPSIANGIVYVGGVALYALNAVDGHIVPASMLARRQLPRAGFSLMPKTRSSGCGPLMRKTARFSGGAKCRANPKPLSPSPTASFTTLPIAVS